MTTRRDSALRFVRERLRARWPWLLAVALPSLFALGWSLRGPLAERLWPEAEAERLRQQAERALRQGRLTADDGSGARELYEAAVAIDPDRAELRAGLGRVAQAAVRRARTAVDDGRFEDAHRALRLARALSAPRAQTDAVAERLRLREAAMAGIDTLLEAADAARVAGRLVGDDAAALPLYRRILALQPQHLRALEGREDALTVVLQQAREAIARGDPARAAAEIALARAYDAGHADLPETQAALAQSVERMRRRADADLRAGRLTRAADGYRAWRDSGIDTADAETALGAVARAHAARSRKAAADFEFEVAREALASAQALAPDAPETIAAREALSRAERARTDAGPKPLTAAAERRLRRLLLEAAAAEARGAWLTPPGDSAFDKLRAARALAPDDAGVRRASARMLPRVHECFEQELRDNRLQRARVCLDARLALEGGSRDADRARARLAQRWVAVGEERLGSGDVEGARAAHDAARALDGKADGLQTLSERLRAVAPVER